MIQFLVLHVEYYIRATQFIYFYPVVTNNFCITNLT